MGDLWVKSLLKVYESFFFFFFFWRFGERKFKPRLSFWLMPHIRLRQVIHSNYSQPYALVSYNFFFIFMVVVGEICERLSVFHHFWKFWFDFFHFFWGSFETIFFQCTVHTRFCSPHIRRRISRARAHEYIRSSKVNLKFIHRHSGTRHFALYPPSSPLPRCSSVIELASKVRAKCMDYFKVERYMHSPVRLPPCHIYM